MAIRLSPEMIDFFHKQGFVIVSTLDRQGKIHCSAKGIAGIEEKGQVYLIDVYRARTFDNLNNNSTMSITAVDEQEFKGYTLKGQGKIVERQKIKSHIIKSWEQRVIDRISKRVIKNIQRNKGSSTHPESRFPYPQYLIEMQVQEVVDLAPAHLKQPSK